MARWRWPQNTNMFSAHTTLTTKARRIPRRSRVFRSCIFMSSSENLMPFDLGKICVSSSEFHTKNKAIEDFAPLRRLLPSYMMTKSSSCAAPPDEYDGNCDSLLQHALYQHRHCQRQASQTYCPLCENISTKPEVHRPNIVALSSEINDRSIHGHGHN